MLISESMAHTPSSPPSTPGPFKPYVPADQSPAEFTIKAIIIGALFGLLFGASTVCLGLRAGLTVSASIPIAVLAISVLKKLGGSTILENNVVQTIGSAGETVAGGVVFTIPALIFLTPYGPSYFSYFQITMLALAGGLLGFFPNATLNVDVSPEYMGVGYVIGPRIAGVMFAGGVLSWMVLLPLLSILGRYMPGPFPPVPASGLRIDQMSAQQIWSAYIRYT